MAEERAHENSVPYDEDILFNPPIWKDLVGSQQQLFRLEALTRISNRLRDEFYFGHGPSREMPEIVKDDWTSRLLDPFGDRPIGYDLPCLLSADRPAKGRIMLCAQDPLRGPGLVKLTVGTFFGIDSNYHRSRRHWGMIWQLIRGFVLEGYDVWVTDAIKLYAGKNVVARYPELRQLCFDIVRDEVLAFRPDRVVAFGALAGQALADARVNASVLRVPHPTAHGQRGTMRTRLEVYRKLIVS